MIINKKNQKKSKKLKLLKIKIKINQLLRQGLSV